MPILTKEEDIVRVLKESKTVAVLGAHKREIKASYYVPRYLQGQQYDIYPVNPAFAGQEILGQEVNKDLSSLKVAIDIVNVFRRSEALKDHVDDILAMKPLPKVVWFQSGIKNDEIATKLSKQGINVIQNRCMLGDHQYLL